MTHIHLLAPDFRVDKRPVKLISNALDDLAKNCKLKYKGAEPEKKANVTDHSLRELFNWRLQEKINSHIKDLKTYKEKVSPYATVNLSAEA